jgi:hypothetical protein
MDALRRESGYSSQSSGVGSISSVGSEGGEHLEEARHELLHGGSGTSSRDGSEEGIDLTVTSPPEMAESWDSVVSQPVE